MGKVLRNNVFERIQKFLLNFNPQIFKNIFKFIFNLIKNILNFIKINKIS